MSTKKKPHRKAIKVKSKKGASSKAKTSIRKEIRNLTLKIVKEKNLKIEDLSRLADDILQQTAATFKDALPASRNSALQQAVDGLADAWAVTVESSTAAVSHARRYGLRLAKKDLFQLNNHLKSLEGNFVKTLEKNAKALGGDMGRELKSLAKRIQRSGSAIRPAIDKVRKSVTEHGPEVVGELAVTGMRAGTNVLSGLLLAASDVLEGVGQSVKNLNKK